jgi:hypothetical protein
MGLGWNTHPQEEDTAKFEIGLGWDTHPQEETMAKVVINYWAGVGYTLSRGGYHCEGRH